MSVADEIEHYLAAMAATDTVLPVESYLVEAQGDVTEVHFLTETGVAVAALNRDGVRDLIDQLQTAYFSA